MKLKSLSNDPQYTDAGLEEAYHIVYYIPKGYTDTTKWTSMIKQFKWNEMIKMISILSINALKP